MIDNIDVESLSFEQLQALQKSAEKALQKQKQQKIDVLRTELEAKIRESGFTVREVFADLIPERPATPLGIRKPAKPKFFNPQDPSVTWSGRGKQPHWYRDHVAAGRSVDDIRIEETAEIDD